MLSCPSSKVLEAYLAGQLSENDISHVTEHLVTCNECESTIRLLETNRDPLVSAVIKELDVDPYADEPELEAALGKFKRAIAFESGLSRELPDSEDPARSQPKIRDYQVLCELGRGGMGAVYLARHQKLKRDVALKVLPSDRMRDRQSVARFEREMEAVGKLEHPYIVRATDAGEHDGMHYLVMEYVPGVTLSELVREFGPLPIADSCELVRQAAEGLQYVHEHGLVHRDIKPANLMLTPQGTVKILDLGLALLQSHGESRSSELTSDGQVMGTIDYMAPEQGGDSHAVDIRADIYSLGATLYKLLTGESPLGTGDAAPAKRLLALATRTPLEARAIRPDIPEPLNDIVQGLLAKSAEHRPATPADVALAVAPFAVGANLKALLTQNLAESSTADVQSATDEHLTRPSTETQTTPPPAPKPGVPFPEPAAPRTPRRRVPLIAIAGGMAFAFLVLAIWVIIRDKDGSIIARFKLDKGQTVEIASEQESEGRTKTDRPNSADNPVVAAVESSSTGGPRPGPLDEESLSKLSTRMFAPNEPLSPAALVTNPAEVQGAFSWTIEPLAIRQFAGAEVSPNRKYVAVISGGLVRIYNLESKQIARLLTSPRHWIARVAWSPNSQLIATRASVPVMNVRREEIISIWNAETGSEVQQVPSEAYWEQRYNDRLSFSKDGRKLGFERYHPEDAIHFVRHDLTSGTETSEKCSEGSPFPEDFPLSDKPSYEMEKGSVYVVANSTDQKHLLAPLAEQNNATQILVQAREDSDEFAVMPLDSPVIEQVSTGKISWTQDRKRFVQAQGNKSLVWDASNGKLLQQVQHDFPVMLTAISPDGERIATADEQGNVQIFAVDSGESLHFPSTTFGPKRFLSWLPNDDWLACGGTGGFELIDPRTGRREDLFDFSLAPATDGVFFRSHVWLSGSKLLALRCTDGIHVFDTEQNVEARFIPAKPDGRFSHDGESYLWFDGVASFKADLATGETTRLPSVVALPNEGWIAISDDGHLSANGSDAGEIIYVVETAHGQQIFSPAEFASRFDWTNDPAKARVAINLKLPDDAPGPEVTPANLTLESPEFQFEPGKPISTHSLVTKPARINGLVSWTVETLPGRESAHQIEYSKDGRWFITASNWDHYYGQSASITLWDAKLRAPVRRILLPDNTTTVHWSPDSQYLLVGQANGKAALILDLQGRVVRRTAWDPVRAYLHSWSADGRTLASTLGTTSGIYIHDATSGAILDVVETIGEIDPVYWSADGRRLMTVEFQQRGLLVWDTATKRVTRSHRAIAYVGAAHDWLGATDRVVSVALEPTQHVLRITGANTLSDGKTFAPLGSATLRASPDGKLVAVWRDQALEIIDTFAASVTRKLQAPDRIPGTPAWSPDGRMIAAAGAGNIYFWRTHAMQPLDVAVGSTRGPVGVRWSADGTHPETDSGLGSWSWLEANYDWSEDGAIYIRNADGDAFINNERRTIGMSLYRVAVSGDGRLFALGLDDGSAQIWSPSETAPIRTFAGPGHCYSVDLSRDGRLLATSHHTKAVIRSTETEDLLDTIETPSNATVQFSPDDQHLAIRDQNELMIYDVSSRTIELTVSSASEAGTNGERPIRWLPDGKTVATLCPNHLIRCYDKETGQQVREFYVGSNVGQFNRDASIYVGWDTDSTVRVFDTATGELVQTITYLRDDNWIVVSPDGHYRCSPGAEKWICYVALMEDGSQVTLTPAEFERNYGWSNDPNQLQRQGLYSGQ